LLKEGSVIIEPTSGNTGVGLAMVAAVKQMKLVLVMPESMSIERRRLMTAYGAQLELTPRAKGMPGAIARAQEMVAADPKAWMPSQFDNPANVAVHEETTAQEILADLPDVDVYITGVGTGGHLTVRLLLGALSGVGRPFGRSNQEVQILDGPRNTHTYPRNTHTNTRRGWPRS
jgi:cysteine synthase